MTPPTSEASRTPLTPEESRIPLTPEESRIPLTSEGVITRELTSEESRILRIREATSAVEAAEREEAETRGASARLQP